jgi:hypothetical protein
MLKMKIVGEKILKIGIKNYNRKMQKKLRSTLIGQKYFTSEHVYIIYIL